MVFAPRVVVSPPLQPVDPNNVLSASFDISNVGYVPLEDVGITVAIIRASFPGPPPIKWVTKMKPNGQPDFLHSGLHFVDPTWQHHSLGLDERLTINPESQISGIANEADMAVIVSYRPWMIPMHQKKPFRFVATKDGSGKTYWRSWPINEPAPTD
jgi:hypothetical protein